MSCERHMQNVNRLFDGIFGPVSMDRFQPPNDPEPQAWGVCEYEKCRSEIMPGDSYVEHDTRIYCSHECLGRAIGAEEMTAPEVF